MFVRVFSASAIACLSAVALTAANEPFAGTWKLNLAKSKVSGQQRKIEDLGNNRYKITFGDVSDTLTADGTDQPVHFGLTQAITKQGPAIWKIVTKKDGKVLTTFTETLSRDGKAMASKGTNAKPDGTNSEFEASAKRVGAGSGWVGTWESTDVKISSPDEWVISSYQGDGLTFDTPAYQDVLNMKFDGKEYAETGPTVAPGSTSSGKRVNANTLEVIDKIKDKVMDHITFRVSPDGKTLTLTILNTGQPNPMIIVYDRK